MIRKINKFFHISARLPYQIGHIKSLEKVQRLLVHTCIPAPREELEYSVHLERLNLMSLCNRYTYLAISFVSKCLYGKYDVDPYEYILLNSRHKNTLKFCYTYVKTDSFKYNVFNTFPAYFDQLFQDLCDQPLFSTSGFLMNTKKHFKNLIWN